MRTTLARLASLTAAGAVGLGLWAAPAHAVAPTGKARGVTTVTLTTAAVADLAPLSPAPVAPAVLGGSPLQAAFPIVGTLRQGVVRHVGGLSLTGGGNTLTLTNYDIAPAAGVLTADAALNGTDLGRIPLFTLAAAPAATGCADTAELDLSSAAAGALHAVFGTPTTLAGTEIGTACVAPRA